MIVLKTQMKKEKNHHFLEYYKIIKLTKLIDLKF